MNPLLQLLAALQAPAMAQDRGVELDFSQPAQQQVQPMSQISRMLNETQMPQLKEGALWGTQTKYPERIVQSSKELQPLLNQLNENQKQTAEFIATEAQKRGINPGFAIAQAFHETYQNKDPKTIFANTGGNLTGMKATSKDRNYAFVRTFEKITPEGWVSELQKRPWIIFQPGTTKQDKNIINTTPQATQELNTLLQEARKTKAGSPEWNKLAVELNRFNKDSEGKLAISIKDRFKKFANPQEGIINSLELLKKKIK